MGRGGQEFRLPETEASEVHSEHGLLDGLVMQVATQGSLDKLRREAVETFEQFLAEEGAVGAQQMRNLRSVSA